MSRMFLVNIPLMFAAVWRVLQMFVDDRVKAKIRFLRKADFHILHEFVDRDQLPESLGGKAKEKLLSDKQGMPTGSTCQRVRMIMQTPSTLACHHVLSHTMLLYQKHTLLSAFGHPECQVCQLPLTFLSCQVASPYMPTPVLSHILWLSGYCQPA